MAVSFAHAIHNVLENSRNTEARMKETVVGRPDTASSPTDPKSRLNKQTQIKTKIIDEDKHVVWKWNKEGWVADTHHDTRKAAESRAAEMTRNSRTSYAVGTQTKPTHEFDSNWNLRPLFEQQILEGPVNDVAKENVPTKEGGDPKKITGGKTQVIINPETNDAVENDDTETADSKKARKEQNKLIGQKGAGDVKESEIIDEEDKGSKVTYERVVSKDKNGKELPPDQVHASFVHTHIKLGDNPHRTNERHWYLLNRHPKHKEMKERGYRVHKFGEHDTEKTEFYTYPVKHTHEETEYTDAPRLFEVSKKTISGYIEAANRDWNRMGQDKRKHADRYTKRQNGLKNANAKMAGKPFAKVAATEERASTIKNVLRETYEINEVSTHKVTRLHKHPNGNWTVKLEHNETRQPVVHTRRNWDELHRMIKERYKVDLPKNEVNESTVTNQYYGRIADKHRRAMRLARKKGDTASARNHEVEAQNYKKLTKRSEYE